MTVHGFYLFSSTGQCLYRVELTEYVRKTSAKEYERFLFGILRTIRNFAHFVSHKARDNIVRVVSTDTFKLHFYMSATNLRFVVITSTKVAQLDQTLHHLYGMYVECVLKNPLYQVGTPINVRIFHEKVIANLSRNPQTLK